MKFTDIISRGISIEEGIAQLFIADKDFSYMGLPILKNALVYYNGKDSIKINMVGLGLFQDSNVPHLIKEKLPKNSNNGLNRLIEKVSSCSFEIDILNLRKHGIWHYNHFDKWAGKFSDYIDRINEIPILEYSEINFSSLMYSFDTESKTLNYFINVKPINLNINDYKMKLPGYLEISLPDTIVPLQSMEYFGVLLEGFLSLSENGIISGSCAQEFEAEILLNNKMQKIIISKGTQLKISSNGSIETGLFNDKTNKVENYTLIKSR